MLLTIFMVFLTYFLFVQGAFVRTYSVMGDRKQHDAQEFLIYLLDALHEDTNKVRRLFMMHPL